MDGRVSVGGSRVLAGLIDEYGEAILSDLLLYYRVDLRDLFSDEASLSPRYALALIVHLPLDGAYYAARRGGQQYRGWDMDRYALVALVNAQRATNHILMMVNRDPKKAPPKPPEPFPTPDLEQQKANAQKPGSFAAIAASMMAAQRQRREKAHGP